MTYPPIGQFLSRGFVLVSLFALSACSPGGSTNSAESIAAVAADAQSVSVSVANATVTEGDQGVQKVSTTITLSAPVETPVSVQYRTIDDSAIAGQDYTSTSGTVQFSAGETSKQVSIDVLGDVEQEGEPESFTVEIFDASDPLVIANAQADIVISDDDAPGNTSPTLVVDAQPASENSGTLNVTLYLSAVSANDVTFDFGTGTTGTATAADDYVAVDTSGTIVAGTLDTVVQIQLVDDNVDELNETIALQISNLIGAEYSGSAEALILDNDRSPTIAVAETSVVEGDSGTTTLDFTLELSAASALDVAVSYTTISVTASPDSDYLEATGSVVIPAGQTSTVIEVTVTGDQDVEPNETLALRLQNPSNASLANAVAIGSIQTDDQADPALPTLSIANIQVEEGAQGTLNLTLSSAAANDVVVTYATVAVTANNSDDFVAAAGSITFSAGSLQETLVIETLDDATFEDSELFIVALTDLQGPAVLAVNSAVVTIDDNDVEPQVSVANLEIVEGTGSNRTETLTFTSNRLSSADITISYRTLGATATSGTDFLASSGSVTIPAGELEAFGSVVLVADGVDESNETFTYEIVDTQGAGVAQASATILILDDDEPALSNLSISNANALESDNTVQFVLSLSSVSSLDVSVDFQTLNRSAQSGSDFVGSTGQLIIPAGSTSISLFVSLVDDNVEEGVEQFDVTLTNVNNAVLSDATGRASITDDDEPPTNDPVDLSIADASATEGNSGQSQDLNFVVSVATSSSQPVSIDYATQPGSALADVDFAAASGTLTIAAGETTGLISVATIGDDNAEGTETFTLVLSNPVGATVVDNQALGTILDDEGAPSLAISAASVTEGNSGSTSQTFTISLSNASTTAVTANYTTVNGSALSGDDFSASSGSITIPAGEVQTQIAIAVVGDVLDETNETYSVSLSNPQNATLAVASAQATITDNDNPPSIGIDDVTRSEGDSPALVTVTLSGPSGKTVTVSYATENATAVSGSDYTTNSGTLTFSAGQVSKTVTVNLVDDNANEPEESLSVRLSSATNATIADDLGTITITDDDVASVTVRLTWNSPTTNSNGTLLTDLAGFKIFQGPNTAGLIEVASQNIQGSANSAQSVDINNVTTANKCFAIRAFDTSDNQGDLTPTQCWSF